MSHTGTAHPFHMWTKFGDDMSKRSWVMLDKTDRQTDKPTNEHTCKNWKFWQVIMSLRVIDKYYPTHLDPMFPWYLNNCGSGHDIKDQRVWWSWKLWDILFIIRALDSGICFTNGLGGYNSNLVKIWIVFVYEIIIQSGHHNLAHDPHNSRPVMLGTNLW